jgi:hypothetical protein
MDLARSGGAPSQARSPLIKWVLPGGVVALTVALIGGYEFHWSWTGVTPSDELWGLLHVLVLPVVLATDAPTKHYMARRTQEGMSKPEIIRCLKRYVAREIYRELVPRTARAAAA